MLRTLSSVRAVAVLAAGGVGGGEKPPSIPGGGLFTCGALNFPPDRSKSQAFFAWGRLPPPPSTSSESPDVVGRVLLHFFSGAPSQNLHLPSMLICMKLKKVVLLSSCRMA